MYGYIYKTTNLVNGKIYIGQHKCKTFDEKYYGSGYVLHLAIKKYGIENFKIEIIDIAESFEELNKKEKYWIIKLNSRNSKIGYNLKDGGVDGTYNEEVKIKISKHLKGSQWMNDGKKNYLITKRLQNFAKEKGLKKGSLLKYNMPENAKIKISKMQRGSKWMSNGEIKSYVHPDKIEKFLNEGWYFINPDNLDSKGSRWMYKENKNSLVKNNKIEEYLKKGWTFGCPIATKKFTGSKWMNNGIESHLVLTNQIDKYLEQGYKFGRLNFDYNKFNNKNKKCINNGKILKYIDKNEVNYYLNKGWKLGQLKGHKDAKNNNI